MYANAMHKTKRFPLTEVVYYDINILLLHPKH